MPTRSFDVVIIGGGNAGMGATVATREAGLKVALIEPDLLGGTCPNRGCMPKKVLVAAAHALDEIERAAAHHIAVGKPSLDWAALIDREKAMISGIPASLEGVMNRRGVEVIRERGRFVGPTRSPPAAISSRPSTSSSPPVRHRGGCRSLAPS
jgi:glutathione reductase (NADPH)